MIVRNRAVHCHEVPEPGSGARFHFPRPRGRRFLKELVTFIRDLNEEEQRHVRENTSEEELAVFDIVTRPGPDLAPQETEAIKKVCKDLLAKLKTEKLVFTWQIKLQGE